MSQSINVFHSIVCVVWVLWRVIWYSLTPPAIPHTFSFSQTKIHIQKLPPLDKGIKSRLYIVGRTSLLCRPRLCTPHIFSTHSRGFWKTEVGRTNHPGQPARKEKNVWFLLCSIKICCNKTRLMRHQVWVIAVLTRVWFSLRFIFL